MQNVGERERERENAVSDMQGEEEK